MLHHAPCPRGDGNLDTAAGFGAGFGNEFAGYLDFATFVSTYDDGTNPQHYQQQVVASVQIP